MEKKCEGVCSSYGECRGEVKAVKVEGHGFVAPFFFDYCEEAIETDRAHGWTVTVLDDEEVEQAEEDKE